MDTPSIKTIIYRQLKELGDGVNLKLFKDGHNVWNLLGLSFIVYYDFVIMKSI